MANYTLKDLGWNRIKASLNDLHNKVVKVGLFNPKLAQIGFWNEFGTKHIVETPFLRRSLKGSDLTATKNNMKKCLNGLYRSDSAMIFLNNIGSFSEKIIKHHIINRDFTPNKAGTVSIKGFDHRLIHKANLYGAIIFKVEGG